MTNQEAKFILEAYRANGNDADQALFSEALRQARNDPALMAWFERARAQDAAIAGKLREITPPQGLREAILAGAKASATRRNPWTRTLPWLAMAAGIMMVAAVGIAMWPTKASAERAQFTAFAVNDTLHAKHGGHGPGSGQLAAILSEPATRLSAGLPIDFSALQANGCRTVQFAGRDVLEVCFKRDGVWFHCYIGNRADFPGMPASEPPQFMEETKVAAASWADASHYFVLVGEGGLQAVKRLL